MKNIFVLDQKRGYIYLQAVMQIGIMMVSQKEAIIFVGMLDGVVPVGVQLLPGDDPKNVK